MKWKVAWWIPERLLVDPDDNKWAAIRSRSGTLVGVDVIWIELDLDYYLIRFKLSLNWKNFSLRLMFHRHYNIKAYFVNDFFLFFIIIMDLNNSFIFFWFFFFFSNIIHKSSMILS